MAVVEAPAVNTFISLKEQDSQVLLQQASCMIHNKLARPSRTMSLKNKVQRAVRNAATVSHFYFSCLPLALCTGLTIHSARVSLLCIKTAATYSLAVPRQQRKGSKPKARKEHQAEVTRFTLPVPPERQMDGLDPEFWSLPRQRRLNESILLCEDLLCLASHRLPEAQGTTKER
jgi:hypothetical protein